MAEVVVYTRPGCPYSAKLRLGLKMRRIAFRQVDVWQDPAASDLVKSVNDGDELVPTVEVGGRYLSNPSVREVREAMASA